MASSSTQQVVSFSTAVPAMLPPPLSSPSPNLLLSTLRGPRTMRKWDDRMPAVLRPLVRAYLLGYASAVAPRLLALVLKHVAGSIGRRKASSSEGHQDCASWTKEPFLTSLQKILRRGLDWQRFPAFCAAIVGGSTLLEIPLKQLFDRSSWNLSELSRKRLARWVATFVAAWLSLQLLQSKQSAAFVEQVPVKSEAPPGAKYETTRYAGRTLDTTLFALARALDVVVGELWAQHRARRVVAGKWTVVEASIGRITDASLFALSSGLIMWTWIYTPTRLPRAYDKWIGSAAAVDPRLTEALRRCRSGQLIYGRDTGQAPLLSGMCVDYGLPIAWGDPARTVPFPCEIVHMGAGSSCEYHALLRFARAFRWSLASVYLPLNLALALRGLLRRGASARSRGTALVRALIAATRSSAFLSAFIALFYYGVCLARTRLGPRLLRRGVATAQHIDGGICVASGCMACGWSVLLEGARRRGDMALFVAPRALATLLPRRYAQSRQWRETLVFAASAAVVFTCVLENPRRVRGVLGGVLASVLQP